MSIRQVRVGDVLELRRKKVSPEDGQHYRQIGVYSWGKGIIENEPIPARELSKVEYYELPLKALILSNIQAWEAAIAVSDERHAGFIASQRFLPYHPVDERIDVRYACHYFLSDRGMAQIRRASPGSITRNRTLGMKAFEALVIPLPDIHEQRKIADQLDSLAAVSVLQQQSIDVTNRTCQKLGHSLFESTDNPTALAELLSETSRFEPVSNGSSYRTAGVKWYAEGIFARDAKPAHEIKAARLNRLVEGELIYNRLFAWKGSFALTSAEKLHASNEFPTFKIDQSRVLPEYLMGWLSLPAVWQAVERASTGATPTSRNRLKQVQLLELRIPLPSMADQTRVVEVLRRIKKARVLNAERSLVAKALTHAARNASFDA